MLTTTGRGSAISVLYSVAAVPFLQIKKAYTRLFFLESVQDNKHGSVVVDNKQVFLFEYSLF